MEVGFEEAEDILIIEDNPGDIRLIEEAIKASPLDPTIHIARTRDEALEILSHRGEFEENPSPDLVLVDWNLSQNSGEDVIQAVKAADSAIPVVVMTGSKSGLQWLESATPTADEYIEKQTDLQAYIDILRSCGADQ